MIFALIIGIIGAAGLLAVMGALSSGRIRLDDDRAIRRSEKPMTFFLIVVAAAVVFGAMLAGPAFLFWQMLSYQQG